MIDMKKCSRCGAKFTDLIASIKLSLLVYRLKESGVPETIPNLKQTADEFLCKDCFDKFADILSQMNLNYDVATESVEDSCCDKPLSSEIVEDCEYAE